MREMPSGLRKKQHEGDEMLRSSEHKSKVDVVLGEAPLFLQTKITQESQIFKRRLSKLVSINTFFFKLMGTIVVSEIVCKVLEYY